MDDLRQEVIDYLELALYAAAEHVDDISLIAKGFFDDNKKGTFHETAKVVHSLFGKTWCIAAYGSINCQLRFERCRKHSTGECKKHQPVSLQLVHRQEHWVPDHM
jgi:hypothetical protein